MTEAAQAPSIETVWFMEATYAPDAAETRVPFRARHMARIAELKAAGVIVEAGAFTDVSASVLLVRAESEEAAIDPRRDGHRVLGLVGLSHGGLVDPPPHLHHPEHWRRQ